MTPDSLLPDQLKKMQGIALPLGLVLTGVAVAFALLNPIHLQGYLVGFLFALGAGLGGFLALCVIHLAGGAWSMNIRRICEAAAATVPVIGLFLLPILLQMKALYPWLHTAELHDHVAHIVEKKSEWLTAGGFQIRAVIYYVLWVAMILPLLVWSRKQDETGDLQYRAKMKFLAGPGVLAHFIIMTFAAVDWVMSLEPVWFSSIFGVIFVIGQVLTILSFSILFVCWLARFEPIRTTLTANRLHSLGKLQFAFIVFWTYIELSQFVIIYAANLPEEISWYMNRAGAPDHPSPYRLLTFCLVFSQFVIPFLVLLNRKTKQMRDVLPWIAAILLVVRVVDLYWIVSPSLHEPVTQLYHNHDHQPVAAAARGPLFGWMDVVGPLGFASLFFGLFLMHFRKYPVLPVKDPMFSEKLEHEIKATA
jgi:hypothetical protein